MQQQRVSYAVSNAASDASSNSGTDAIADADHRKGLPGRLVESMVRVL